MFEFPERLNVCSEEDASKVGVTLYKSSLIEIATTKKLGMNDKCSWKIRRKCRSEVLQKNTWTQLSHSISQRLQRVKDEKLDL